jgi:hypothetical protein
VLPGSAPRGRTPRRTARRIDRIAGIAVVALCVAALGYVVADALDANATYDRAHSALATTEGQNKSVSEDLAQLRASLALLSARVANDTAAATQDANQLKTAQAELVALQEHVTQQTVLIGSLRTCLGGVERALNALSVGRPDRVVVELQAVGASCKSATGTDG